MKYNTPKTKYSLTTEEAYIIDTLRANRRKEDKRKLEELFNTFSTVMKDGTHETFFYFLYACNLWGVPYIDADIVREFLIEHIDDKELLKAKGVIEK